jgi:DNA repair exonuclease SbcCD nuclease subunit
MKLELLGDPHLGKSFNNDVPPHRKGDREKLQWAAFKRSLSAECDLHVCVGDIFNSTIVSYCTVLDAAREYRKTCAQHPRTQYVVIRGNHDKGRTADVVTAYEVFAELVAGVQNLKVLGDDVWAWQGYLFVPFDPFRPAADLLPTTGKHETRRMLYTNDGQKFFERYEAVFGHWDEGDYGKEQPNLIPLDALAKITNCVYSGHVHKPHVTQYGDLTVNWVGSLMPYAHGEDADDSIDPLYVTLTLQELEDGRTN